MICAWKELLSILPQWLRKDVDIPAKDTIDEIRLRINAPPEFVTAKGSTWLQQPVKQEDLAFCINSASRYSPWAAASVRQGYISAPGGHRIGLCGDAVVQDGCVTGIRDLRSIVIRVARDFPGIGKKAASCFGSLLVLGAPGWGKTTLLRDLARQISERDTVCVIDERGELFPPGLPSGKRMDILTGCPKEAGIQMALRTMGPRYIAVDEITAKEDIFALRDAAFCGVKLLSSAHAASLEEFYTRPIYRPIWECPVFDTAILLRSDRTYYTERMNR